jgi:hypothetical protein
MEMLDQPSWRWGLTLIASTMGVAADAADFRLQASAEFARQGNAAQRRRLLSRLIRIE